MICCCFLLVLLRRDFFHYHPRVLFFPRFLIVVSCISSHLILLLAASLVLQDIQVEAFLLHRHLLVCLPILKVLAARKQMKDISITFKKSTLLSTYLAVHDSWRYNVGWHSSFINSMHFQIPTSWSSKFVIQLLPCISISNGNSLSDHDVTCPRSFVKVLVSLFGVQRQARRLAE